ncbi:MAG: hypothetical protein ACW986_05735 [Promethearchaeota archaeon]
MAALKSDDDIDLSIDEFEELDDEQPLKFEKRKAGKADLEDSEEFQSIECPFCGEMFDDLASHIRTCEFAPDDASIEDIIPTKKKRRKKTVDKPSSKKSGEKQKCQYCGKEFVRLGKHLNSCPKRPVDLENADSKEE